MENNNFNIKSGERLSFYKLFTEKDFHIEIPIIQRDYAQGRASQKVVRKDFLNALFDYLNSSKDNHDLDFIYGSVYYSNGVKKFIPLDGQQRLTTLFLLHWYLATLTKEQDKFRNIIAVKNRQQITSKFTYETRTSSREFCDALVTNDIDIKSLLPSDEGRENGLSKTIKDKGWYFLSWKYDPTIQAMLIMLDAIHMKFKDRPEFNTLLTNPEKPKITFLFLILEEFRLSDDLYIKMNARGKPLTSFENFKAKLEKHFDTYSWNDDEKKELIFNDVKREVHPKEYFSFKIDTSWANFFWQYRDANQNISLATESLDDNNRDKSYDDELMHFIRVILANSYASISIPDNNPNLEYIIGTSVARSLDDYSDNVTFHDFEEMNTLTKSSIKYLIDAFDVLSNGDKAIHLFLSDKSYFDEDKIFRAVLNHDLSLPHRVQFHAYLRYLIAEANEDGIHDWMRVIHNLTENTRIDGAAEVARGIQSIDKLIETHSNILSYLIEDNCIIDFFSSKQVQEEQIKAHLISRSDKWKSAIEQAEKHPYFKGQIGFLLEFSEILKYYEINHNCNWEPKTDQEYYNLFLDYSSKAQSIFSLIEMKKWESMKYLWERAVLSKGDYFITSSVGRKNMLCTASNMRDFSWKRLLRLPPGTEKNIEELMQKRTYVKSVFDDTRFDSNDLNSSLHAICSDQLNDWRRFFIPYPEVFAYSKQGFIRHQDNEILIYNASQHNHRYAEINSYILHLNLRKSIDLFHPFTNIWYFDSKGEVPCCVIDEWRKDDEHNYAIDINFLQEENQYLVRFFNRGDTGIESSITSILVSENMTESNNYPKQSFVCKQISEKDVFDFLEKLNNQLTTI